MNFILVLDEKGNPKTLSTYFDVKSNLTLAEILDIVRLRGKT